MNSNKDLVESTQPSYGSEEYFEAVPTIPSRRQKIALRVPGVDVELISDRGVFSYTGLDAGTKVLLRVAPDPAIPGDLLDFGCGYGPIAVTLAIRYPDRTIWAVDVNERALELVKDNATNLGLTNIRAVKPEEIVSQTFAGIYSNPPIRIGKDSMQEIIIGAAKKLLPGGRAYWVVKRNLGGDSFAVLLSESGYPTARFASKQGYRILETGP